METGGELGHYKSLKLTRNRKIGRVLERDGGAKKFQTNRALFFLERLWAVLTGVRFLISY